MLVLAHLSPTGGSTNHDKFNDKSPPAHAGSAVADSARMPAVENGKNLDIETQVLKRKLSEYGSSSTHPKISEVYAENFYIAFMQGSY